MASIGGGPFGCSGSSDGAMQSFALGSGRAFEGVSFEYAGRLFVCGSASADGVGGRGGGRTGAGGMTEVSGPGGADAIRVRALAARFGVMP